MSIQTGQKIPSVTLKRLGGEGMESIDIAKYVAGRKVVLFAVPGAFTPSCSEKHLPGYILSAPDIKAGGVDEIICLSVNDPFVMKAWGEKLGVGTAVTMLSDGNCEFTRAIGMELDGSGACLGTRSKRYSMMLEDGTVKSLEVEANASEVSNSGAQACALRIKQKAA